MTAITAVDYHTGGEPFRIVTGGVPPLEGRSVLDKRRFALDELDHVRRLLSFIRDPVLKGFFLRRHVVREILGNPTADALAVASGAVIEPGEPVIASIRTEVPADP